MSASQRPLSGALAPLAAAWLGLLALTLLGPMLGERFHGAAWLQVLVAGIVWVKGMLVARRFLEVGPVHPFIRRTVLGFVAFAPLALVAVTYGGAAIARWTTL